MSKAQEVVGPLAMRVWSLIQDVCRSDSSCLQALAVFQMLTTAFLNSHYINVLTSIHVY